MSISFSAATEIARMLHSISADDFPSDKVEKGPSCSFCMSCPKTCVLPSNSCGKARYLLRQLFQIIELKFKKSARHKIFQDLLTHNGKDNENVTVVNDKHADTMEVQQFFVCTT